LLSCNLKIYVVIDQFIFKNRTIIFVFQYCLIEILKELDNIDTLGNGISLQIKILDKIETLLDDL
jgi:hypothetical protein